MSEVEVARVVVTRTLTEDDDIVTFETEGDPTALELVGMLHIALHTILEEGIEDD